MTAGGLIDKMSPEDKAVYQAYNDLSKILHELRVDYNDEYLTKEFAMGYNAALTRVLNEVTKKVIEVQKRYVATEEQ